jgi:hypothetical protein
LIAAVLFAAGATAATSNTASADPEARPEPTAQQVQHAIDKGVEYLERKEDLDKDFGHWTAYRDYTGSTTELCTLALLSSGVPATDPHVKKALDYLRTLKPEKTYTASLQTLLFCLADPKRDRALIQNNVDWFEQHQITEGAHRGGWAYPGLGNGDNSNSQAALAALYEAERAGVPVKEQTWRLALSYWKDAQNPDGSFGYYNLRGKIEVPGTGSMTCAGVASLAICARRVAAIDAQADGRVHCCTQPSDDSAERIERGLRWLGQNFSIEYNPKGVRSLWQFYYRDGLERVGQLTGRRFIGAHDWFREAAAYLVGEDEQLASGAWQSSGSSVDPEHDPNIATSYALLFLTHGRRPVLIAKLQHGPADDWNRHPSDLANLTSCVETRWKREFPLGLSWQVVDLPEAKLDDLRQSPVLFLSGSRSPEVDAPHATLLRRYIEQGGCLFAAAACSDGDGFDRGFRALLPRIFPHGFKLEPLPPGHPISQAEKALPAEQQRALLGIEDRGRTCVVYSPPSKPGAPQNALSCLWQFSSPGEQRFPPEVAAQIDAANSIGAAVLEYATNRKLKTKDRLFPSENHSKPADGRTIEKDN